MATNPNKPPTNPNKHHNIVPTADQAAIEAHRASLDDAATTADMEQAHERALYLNYIGDKIDRLEKAAVGLGIPGDEWYDKDNTTIDGAHQLVELAGRLHEDDTYQVKPYEATFLEYMDSEEGRIKDRATINEATLTVKVNASRPSDAQLDDMNQVIAAQLGENIQNLRTQYDNATDDQAKRGIKGQIKNSQTAKDILEGTKDKGISAAEYLEKARQHEAGTLSDAEFEAAEKELEKHGKLNKIESKAYGHVHSANGKSKNPLYTSNPTPAVKTPKPLNVKQLPPKSKTATPGSTLSPSAGTGTPAAGSTQTNGGTSSGSNANTSGTAASTSGQQPPAPPRGTATHTRGANLVPMAIPATTADLQRNNVNAAARQLTESMRGRSRGFFGNGPNDDIAHANLQRELHRMMQYEKPDWFDTASDEEKVKYANQYVAHYYNEVVKETVDGMAGEKDEKKRKRNRRLIRLGATALGFAVGGPVGGAVAGAISLGVTKAIDSEFKNRKKLYSAVNEYAADDDISDLINNIKQNNNGRFDFDEAFAAASARLQKQVERGVVNQRRRNIGFAGLKGAAWAGGSLVVMGQAVEAAHVMGDTAYQWVSQASWSGTHASWAGGLNPNFNYTMHEKPISWKVLEGLWKVSTNSWGTAAIATAGVGGAGYLAYKKRADSRNRNDYRLAG